MKKNLLSQLIEANQARIVSDARNYIGASIIGSNCLRQIWYEFKGEQSEDVPPKTRRHWDIGKKLESLVLDWLENSGLHIAREWYDLGSDSIKSFSGHVDAVWIKDGESHAIIEIKTAKDSSFKIFVKKGVKEWRPEYYAQIQSYMGMSGIHSAYILVLNKDNSEIFDELVTFDEYFYMSLEEKASLIANCVTPPPKISNSPIWHQCKTCKFHKVCHD